MLVIAHRGASGHAPENTMAAFRKAVAMGATFIETDLQLSRDAHFVGELRPVFLFATLVLAFLRQSGSIGYGCA